MEIGDLDLPADLVAHYEDRGIESLYPPQEAAVEAGVLEGESVVAAVPTASGKTLIAQLAMATADGRALYVVPLRALATEKHDEFSRLPGVSVGIATGNDGTTSAELQEYDVVVATSEKVDSLIRRGGAWLSDMNCMVVDEAHLLHDEERGPTLEATVAKLRELVPDVQIVALSATIANPETIADWLDATPITTDWRPVDLRRGVYHEGEIAFVEDRREIAVPAGDEATPALIRDTLAGGGQCLAFTHSRRGTEELAERIAGEWFGAASSVAEAVNEVARTDTGRRLADCVSDGIAFHHAGLRAAHRSLVEDAFREREIDVICATPTLAAGVNVPARRVIVRDWRRYTDAGREPLPVLEVHQMFGRAGRPHLDPYGEAILVATDDREAMELRERYVEGTPEAVTSKLASQDALRTHVLAAIASGFADSRAELLDILDGTFYAAQEDHETLVDIADLLLEYLESVDMIRREDGLEATDLGEQVSRLYVDPRTAAEVLDDLARAERLPECSRVTVLVLVCDTPDMSTVSLRRSDWPTLNRFAERHEPMFVTDRKDASGEYGSWLSALKTARVLGDWIDGVPENEITETHGIGPGDLRTKVERGEWLLNATESLAEVRDIDIIGTIRKAREGIEARRGS